MLFYFGFFSLTMEPRKELVMLGYVAVTSIFDLAILFQFWGIFGIEGFVVEPSFSQALVDAEGDLHVILWLMVVQSCMVFVLGWMVRRQDRRKLHVIGIALVCTNISLLVLFPAFLDSDIGVIITFIESLSSYMAETPVWGAIVTANQTTFAIGWLVTGLARNLFWLFTRYMWAKAVWHESFLPGLDGWSRVLLRYWAAFHAFSFLLVLLPFGPLPLVLSLANSILVVLVLARLLLVNRHAGNKKHGVLDIQPTRSFSPVIVKFFGIPALVAFMMLVLAPYLVGLSQFAMLQANNFGGWSFFMWGGVLAIALLVYSACRLDSDMYFWVFRVIIKIVMLVNAVQIFLNLGFLSDILAWGWWATIGNAMHGGGLVPPPGLVTAQHVFAFLWFSVIIGGALLFLTRRERASFTPRRAVRRAKQVFLAVVAAWRAMFSRTTARDRKIARVPVIVFTVLGFLLVTSTWGYGVPVILHPHPEISTRVSFWTSGSLVPAPYLDVIQAKNVAYNTSSRFFSWGNQFTASWEGQFLIDIPGASYTLTCGSVYETFDAGGMIAYLQRLVDARVTYWFHASKVKHLEPMAELLASTTVNATYRDLVDRVVEGFIFDIESGGDYATYNATAIDEEHAARAQAVQFAQSFGKKMGFTTVAYTIGDWLDGDNDVATLFRIHDFHPPSVQNPVIPAYQMDYYNWMIYRSDQEGLERQLWDPYFSYLHFNEAKAYMDRISSMYPELGIDPSTDLGVSMGVLRSGTEQVFSNTTAGRESFLVELRMANALGISEGVYFYFPYFMNMYTPADYASFYDALHSDWEVHINVNQFVGALGPPFGTLWDLPNIMGTRCFYHVIDHMLNPWFAVVVYSMVGFVSTAWVIATIKAAKKVEKNRL